MIKKICIQILILLIVLSVWWFIFYFQIVSQIIIPSPYETVVSFFHLVFSREVLADLYSTVYKTCVGLVIGIILGIMLGLLLGVSQKIYHAIEFWIELLRSIPPPTLIPLFLLFFGIGDASKIAIAVFVSTLVIAINTVYGVHNVPRDRLLFARTMKLNKTHLFFHIIFFDALPYISSGIRIAISLSLVVVMVGEMLIGTDVGLGNKIISYHLTYEIPSMYATIFLTGLMGYMLNKSYIVFERKYIHWQGK